MNSGDLKTVNCVEISKSNFFRITTLSLHSICSESKKKYQKHLFTCVCDTAKDLFGYSHSIKDQFLYRIGVVSVLYLVKKKYFKCIGISIALDI